MSKLLFLLCYRDFGDSSSLNMTLKPQQMSKLLFWLYYRDFDDSISLKKTSKLLFWLHLYNNLTHENVKVINLGFLRQP